MAAKKLLVRCKGRVGTWPADKRCDKFTTAASGLCAVHRPKKKTKEAA